MRYVLNSYGSGSCIFSKHRMGSVLHLTGVQIVVGIIILRSPNSPLVPLAEISPHFLRITSLPWMNNEMKQFLTGIIVMGARFVERVSCSVPHGKRQVNRFGWDTDWRHVWQATGMCCTGCFGEISVSRHSEMFWRFQIFSARYRTLPL